MDTEDSLKNLKQHAERTVGYFLPLSALECVEKANKKHFAGKSFSSAFYKLISDFEHLEEHISWLIGRNNEMVDELDQLKQQLASMTKERDKFKRQVEKNAKQAIADGVEVKSVEGDVNEGQ